MIPRIGLALAVALLVAAPSAGAQFDPADLTLRLPDLGPGYVHGNDSGGLVIAGEGAAPALTQIYLDHRHTGTARSASGSHCE